MPLRSKRKAADFDPNKSDSEDETFSVSPSKHSRPKPRYKNKPARKRRRKASSDGNSSEDDIISTTEISASDSVEDPDLEEEPEIGASGRPRRLAAKNKQPIIDQDTDESVDDLSANIAGHRNSKASKQPSLWVTLKATSRADVEDMKRSARVGLDIEKLNGPIPSDAQVDNARRSTRRGHANFDSVSLSQPAGVAGKRPSRSGKGPRKNAEGADSADENGIDVKDQPSTDELQRDHYRLAAGASHDSLAEEVVIEVLGSHPSEQPSETSDGDNEHIHDSAGEGSGPKEVPESIAGNDDQDDEDEQGPITRSTRPRRAASQASASSGQREPIQQLKGTRSEQQRRQSSQKLANPESSDFEPGLDDADEDELSDSESSSPRKTSHDDLEDRSAMGRGSKRRRPNTRSRGVSDDSDEQDQLEEELRDLREPKKRKKQLDIIMENRNRSRRAREAKVNYDIMASNAELLRAIEENEEEAPSQSTPSRRTKGTGAFSRSLFSTYGPFGGAGDIPPVLGGPTGLGAVGGAESDSSDDERMQKPKRVGTGLGGLLGATPTSANPGGIGIPPAGYAFGTEVAQGPGGTPSNLGKVKEKQALVDADPLGVDQTVNFDGVGGLRDHINQLKEMVALPLLYPEVFQRFHVTPPRGVLFHGPPGTGKTLLARALANSVSSGGKKVTFYMRKGADALSKWVGEAERQLRMLFEEARKNQPSIIFFDEIDGLAPVRSSKQEQIHASIVSTLLALMDGMDGRGQVIVIGATNRPDSVDPALRRPGRFDREFYFPLPNIEARRAILDIHTKEWKPSLSPAFKDEIAKATKGYGGADIRALCTEAALNAVQRRYPQIYKSDKKLLIDPGTINVGTKDFMISIKNIVPSSERSTASGAIPLPQVLEPLLRDALQDIISRVANVLPLSKRLTALQEAEFEQPEGEKGIKAEQLQQAFDHARVFRPRLLLKGVSGMGQQYLAGALLNHLEGLHVQSFDLATLLSDSTRSSEAAIIQLFGEVRRHKPSVIYIPNVDTWYRSVGDTVKSTFCELLQALAPTDPVLLLGFMNRENEVDEEMMRNLFNFKRNSRFDLKHPSKVSCTLSFPWNKNLADGHRSKKSRHKYFAPIKNYIETSPTEFPSQSDRRPRKLELLMPAPPDVPKEPSPLSKGELKAQKKKDRLLLNKLKIHIQPIMDQLKTKYRKFRLPLIEEKTIRYLFEEDDPDLLTSDLPQEQQSREARPFERSMDEHGVPGLKETVTGRFFYNLDVATIEKRLSNGYYKRPKDFLTDVKKLAKDARTIGDVERLMKANELIANVEVDILTMEVDLPGFVAELENVYQRELKREREMIAKVKQRAAEEGRKVDHVLSNVPPPNTVGSVTDTSTGPIKLGQPLTNGLITHALTPSELSSLTNGFQSDYSDLSNLQTNTQSTSTSIASRKEEDVHMTSSEDRDKDVQSMSSFGPSAQARPLDSYTGGPTTLHQRLATYDGLTQDSAITPMAQGSQPADYTNYASTTSSEKRATGSTGDKDTLTNSQAHSQTPSQSQGDKNHPDFSELHEHTEPNSQLPDTANNTQTSSPPTRPNSKHSDRSSPGGSISPPHQPVQNQAVGTAPLMESPSTNSVPNEPSVAPREQPPRPTAEGLPPVYVSEDYDNTLLALIVENTKGCSVEQLEQLYSSMMDVIWKNKGEWDRVKVSGIVEETFLDELDDIRNMQGLAEIDEESSFELTQRSAS